MEFCREKIQQWQNDGTREQLSFPQSLTKIGYANLKICAIEFGVEIECIIKGNLKKTKAYYPAATIYMNRKYKTSYV